MEGLARQKTSCEMEALREAVVVFEAGMGLACYRSDVFGPISM